MNHVRKAFGDEIDLYQVLGLKDRDEAENPAKLRKAYFRKALVYHPDKTKEKDPEVAKEKFQAISFAYEVLKNPEKRAEYNETGHVDEHDDDDDDANDGSKKDWKDYFDLIFGKVSTSQIDAFAMKYKCSEEEQKDVLAEYKKWQGDLVKMLEYVMLSEPLDAKRWIEDYIKPACEAGTVPDYDANLKKSMKKLEAKIEKEQKKKSTKNKSKKENKKPDSDDESEECDVVAQPDSDATETDSDDGEVIASPVTDKKKKKKKEKVSAQKAKPTKAKPAKKKGKGAGKEGDLFAMIQANQAKRAGSVFASLGARYGVSMEEDDPLGDDEFEKIQARLKKKKRSR